MLYRIHEQMWANEIHAVCWDCSFILYPLSLPLLLPQSLIASALLFEWRQQLFQHFLILYRKEKCLCTLSRSLDKKNWTIHYYK